MAILIATGLIFFVWTQTANTMLSDEWDISYNILIESGGDANLLNALWAPHNEHRIFLPKLITYLNSSMSLAPQRLMTLSILLLLFSYFFCFRNLFGSSFEENEFADKFFAILVPFFFFSLAQKPNFFIGINICWSLQCVGVILTIVGLVTSSNWKVILGFLVNYLSLAGWIALLPIVFLYTLIDWIKFKDSKKLRRFVYLNFITGLLSALYFFKLQTPPKAPIGAEAVLKILAHLIQLIGSPFQPMGRDFAFIMGVLFLVISAIFIVKKRLKFNSPPFQFIFYTLTIGILISFGRFSFWSLGERVAERYALVANLGWLGLLAATYINFKTKKTVVYIVASLLVIDTVVTTAKRIPHELAVQKTQESGRKCLADFLKDSQKNNYDPKCTAYIYPPSDEHLRAVANALYKKGHLSWMLEKK